MAQNVHQQDESLHSTSSSRKYLETFSDNQRKSEFQDFLDSLFVVSASWFKKNNELGTIILIMCVLCSFVTTCILLSSLMGNRYQKPISYTQMPTRILLTSTRTTKPTKTPIPSKTVIPKIIACVGQFQVRVRSGPGTEYDVIGGALPGDCFEFDGRNENSTWVHTKFNQKDGWLSIEFLDFDMDINHLVVIIERK